MNSRGTTSLRWVWSKDIPPSKSLLAWRLMHDKLPTYDNLAMRGCSLPSMCSLCMLNTKTSFHLFFQCPYAINIWRCFASILNCSLHFQTKQDIWSLCDRNRNPCKLAISYALINIINAIWFSINQIRFKSKKIHWKTAISIINSLIQMSPSQENCNFHY